MKALFLHANKYEARIESISTRIGTCIIENNDIGQLEVERMEECLVILFQVESGDGDRQIKRLCKDVKKNADTFNIKHIMLGAFGHLSHKWPENPAIASAIAQQVVDTCKVWIGYKVESSHFGYNKTLLLDVKGHQGAIKHRSYE